MDAERIPARAWMIVMMLFCFMVINFADKAVLGLAAVPIMRDLHLNHTEFGLIGTSFFVFFSLSAVLVGFLVNRVPTKWVLAAMALSWSLCQLPMILPIGLIALVGNRVLLGLGEGPALPVALHAAYKWFPNRRRPLPTSIIALGGAVGVGIAAPGVVYIIVNYSWHAGFAMLGLAGLLWCVAWLWIGHEGPLTAEAFTTGYTRLPYTMLLTSRSMIGQVMVAFAAYWLLIIAVVWLPAYLTKSAGYTQTEVGWIVTLPALLQIGLIPGGAAFSEWLTRRGFSSRIARGGPACAAVFVAGVLTFALPLLHGSVLAILCTALAFSCGSVMFSLGHVIVAEITPVAQRGAMLAIGNAVVTLAGPIAPVVLGLIVDAGTDAGAGFRNGFMLTGSAVAVVAAIGMILIDPERDRARFAAAYAAPPVLQPSAAAAD